MLPHTTHKWLNFISTSLFLMLMNIDMTAVNLALPPIAVDLHLNLVNIQWIISAYLIGGASLVMLGGHLGDVFGHKRIFLIGATLFTLASLGVGLSSSQWGIISMRLCQGFGAAIAWPLAIVIIRQAFLSQEGFAMGLTAGVMAGSMSIGPPLGGVILHYIGWRWIFFINIPIGVVALVMGYQFIPKSTKKNPVKALHIPSAIMLFLGLLILTFAFNEVHNLGIQSPLVLITLVGGFVLLSLFIYFQTKIKNPLLELSLFKNSALASCFIVRFLWQVIWIGTFLILSLLFQNILHYTALQTSAFFLITNIAFALVSPFGGKLNEKYSPRNLMLIALGVYVITFICFALMTKETSDWEIGIIFLLFGIGTGIGFPSLLDATLSLAPSQQKGMVSGILYAALFIGGSIGAIYVSSLLGIIAPDTLSLKLHVLGIHFDHVMKSTLMNMATGVRDIYKLKSNFPLQQANTLIAIIQQSFFHAFMVIMIVSVVISIIIARVVCFIKKD